MVLQDKKSAPIVLALTGASGTIYGLRTLQFLLANGYVVDFIFSKHAIEVASLELGLDLHNLNLAQMKNITLSILLGDGFRNTDLVGDDLFGKVTKNINKSFTLSMPVMDYAISLTEQSNLFKDSIVQNFRIWDEKNIAASCSSGSFKTQGMIISPCSVGSLGHIANGTGYNLISRSADVILKERRKLVTVIRETPFNSIHLKNMLTLSDMGAYILPAIPAYYYQPETLQDHVDFIVGKTLDCFDISTDLFKRWASL